jgi:hypothetical protein
MTALSLWRHFVNSIIDGYVTLELALLDRLTRGEMVQDLPPDLALSSPHDALCEACVLGKGVRGPFPSSQHKPTRPLEVVHVDTAGKFAKPGVHREQYFVVIYDGYTGWREVILVRYKWQIPEQLKHVLVRWMNQTGQRIKYLRSDRGSEFLNTTMSSWALSEGIVMQTSCPGTPQQNGAAERCVRTIKDRARAIMVGVKGSPALWSEAVVYSAYVSNFLPIEGRKVTPFEAFWGWKPSIKNIRVWGCLAYVRIPDKDRGPFDPKYSPGMFVGIDPAVKGWRIRVGNKTILSREVQFDESRQGRTNVESYIINMETEHYLTEDEEVTLTPGEHFPPEAILFPTQQPESYGGDQFQMEEPSDQLPPLVDMDEDDAEQEEAEEVICPLPRRSTRLQQAAVTPCKGEAAAHLPVTTAAPAAYLPKGPVAVTPRHEVEVARQQRSQIARQKQRGASPSSSPAVEQAQEPSSSPASPNLLEEASPASEPVNEGHAPVEVPVSERDLRHYRRCRERNQREARQERLEREIAEADRVVGEMLGATGDASFGIPAHANVFDALVEEGEEVDGPEDVEVDVTGYTGRSEEEAVAHPESEEPTVWEVDQSEDNGETDPLAHVCFIQRGWIGTAQPRAPTARRVQLGEQKEGLLKVRFEETPVCMSTRRVRRRPNPGSDLCPVEGNGS